jgi:hypothetical protein
MYLDALMTEITRRVQDGSLPPYPVQFAPTPEGDTVPIVVRRAPDVPCDGCGGRTADIRVGELDFHSGCYEVWVAVCERLGRG